MINYKVSGWFKDIMHPIFRLSYYFHLPASLNLNDLQLPKTVVSLPKICAYSRVHKSSDSFFSKILEKPSIVQKKMIPHINGLHFSMRWSKKRIQNGRLKIQNGRLKKPSFSSSANSQYLWLWGCLTSAQKQAKNAFLLFLGCFWAYVRQPYSHKSWDKPMPFASINSTNPRTNPVFWGGHFEFLSRPFWIFFLLHFIEKCSPFLWGIIFFCTMDSFSRILEKKLSKLLCTRL